jgi:hypothetical protein
VRPSGIGPALYRLFGRAGNLVLVEGAFDAVVIDLNYH